MSEPKSPTLLFKGWVDTSQGQTVVVIPKGRHESGKAEEHFGADVEVHRAGTAEELDRMNAAIVALEKEKHALQGQNRTLNTEINGMATDPQACSE